MLSKGFILIDYKGKRLFDISLAFIALIFFSPLIIIISLLIYLFDGKSIFFLQKRVGKDGSHFTFIKFRSLPLSTSEVPSDQLEKINISNIGKFIRRTNIDELPQLINILKGDMSIVGPRPALISQKKLFLLRESNGSLSCRPGLTGLAQINSFDNMSIYMKASYDEIYAKKVSLKLDILIILKTFIYLFSPPPKY